MPVPVSVPFEETEVAVADELLDLELDELDELDELELAVDEPSRRMSWCKFGPLRDVPH